MSFGECGAGESIPAAAHDAARPGCCRSRSTTPIFSPASSNAMDAPITPAPTIATSNVFTASFYSNPPEAAHDTIADDPGPGASLGWPKRGIWLFETVVETEGFQNELASSIESTRAFWARFWARVQSPLLPASRAWATKLRIFSTRSC